MKQISILILFIVLSLATLLISCNSATPITKLSLIESRELYIDAAEDILNEYQIKGTPVMIKGVSNLYKLTVYSEGFADLSEDQKKEFLIKLNAIKVPGSTLDLGMAVVESQECIYSYSGSGPLSRNGENNQTPLVLPKNDFEMSWDLYHPYYNTIGGILTIIKRGTEFNMKIVYPDGSQSTYDLTATTVCGGIRFTENPGNISGDFMYIRSDGWLEFRDNDGYIYSAIPEK